MIHLNLPPCQGNDVIYYAGQQLASYFDLLFQEEDREKTIPVILKESSALPGLPVPASPSLDDQYRISATPDRVEILAVNSRSVLLGVYRLLLELGCRFLMPGARHEYIPRIRLEQLEVQVSEAASFRHRGVCIEGADSLENVLEFIDWLPKIGCNVFFLQHLEPEVFLNNWYQHKYNPLLTPENFSGAQKEEMFSRINKAVSLRGLMHHRAGHGWTSKAMGFPLACVPAETSPSEEQRPLLALVNGRRDFWGGIPSNTNLCYSNPRTRNAFADSVLDYATEHPEADYLHVWLADEHNNVCECPQCQGTSPTDQYISLLNEIDAALESRGLSTRIVLLLYQELLWPPVREKLVHPERFTLMFAPISRTFDKSYAERGMIPPLPPYRRNQISLPNTLEENLSFLKAWQSSYHMDSFVYDYPLGRAHYGDLGYRGIARTIWKDIRELPALGLNGYISCQELRAAFPNALPGYVMGRALWNRNLSFEELEEEYDLAAYGGQRHDIRAYLSGLSDLSSPDYFNGIGPRSDERQAARFEQAGQYAARFTFTMADASAEESPLHNFFLTLLDYHREYCILITKALAALAAGRAPESQEAWLEFMNFIRKHELDFQPYLDVYRVLEVATKYTGFTLDIPR